MLQPARVKYRKMHRGNRAGLATRGNTVAFGEYGLMALERCWLDTKQIEAARVAINRNMKRRGKVWIRIFPQKSFTKKPLETRMGKGKGPLESWVAVIRPANVLFEVDGVPIRDREQRLLRLIRAFRRFGVEAKEDVALSTPEPSSAAR